MTTLEIVARPSNPEDVRTEFHRFLECAKTQGWRELKVLFGFAWGNYIYEKDWIEEIMTPDQNGIKIRRFWE